MLQITVLSLSARLLAAHSFANRLSDIIVHISLTMIASRPTLCLRRIGSPYLRHYSSSHIEQDVPSIAPKPIINIKHIRKDPDLYAQNAVRRNYAGVEENPLKIVRLFDEWKASQLKGRGLRERSNAIRTKLSHAKTFSGRDRDDEAKEVDDGDLLQQEARDLKQQIAVIEAEEESISKQMYSLAADIPNLTSPETPLEEPQVIGHINESASGALSSHDRRWRNHVHLGTEFDLIDFASAGTTTGWGWYYLKNEGALLEQALVQYALQVGLKHGFTAVSPPSVAYSHIGAACGFKPRDQNDEQQVYTIAQSDSEQKSGKPRLSLAGTAEIPFAAMKARTVFHEADLPLRLIGSSRCYRAEAGARGTESKGLYRVHEFTKVEMFGWGMKQQSADLFEEMLAIQKEILLSLGLQCRILEMPAPDLGASAYRKQDIEAFFPSRSEKDQGWGEVTSTSMCTDYQTRRLSTRVRIKDGSLEFPESVNATAVAVPRVLAALLENGWDEQEEVIRIPECLWPWVGKQEIHRRPKGSLKEP